MLRAVQAVQVAGRELRYAARLLGRSPGFTLAAVLSLALGIGANTAIFQLLEAVSLRTLPVTRPDELVEIDIRGGRRGIGVADSPMSNVTFPMWEGIRDHQQALSGVFAWAPFELPVGTEQERRRTRGLWASGHLFPTLGLAPHRGRLLDQRDDSRGCAPDAAVISYPYWQRWFGGRDTAIGEPLVIDGQTFHVAGVTPPSFYGLEVGRQFDVALPLCTARLWGNPLERPNYFWLVVMGRLAPGWNVSRASEQMASISPRLMEVSAPSDLTSSASSTWRSFTLTAQPGGYGVSFWRREYERALWLLLGITALVLAIACVNVANLMLARNATRTRELAVRQSLGASRGRLVMHALSESILLAVAGTLIGVVLARVMSRALVLFLTTEDNRLYFDLGLNWMVLAFTSVVATVTCLACGLGPAFRSARVEPATVMKESGRTQGGSARLPFQHALVIAQMAISMVLVLGALLFVRSFRNLVTFDAGFQQDGLLFAFGGFDDLSRQSLPPEQLLARKDALLNRIGALPEVASAAGASHVPLSGMSWTLELDVPAAAIKGASRFMWVSPAYFKTMGMSVLRGRTFDAADTRASRKVMLVNETFVQRYLKGLKGVAPIGAIVRVAVEPGKPEASYEVIGIVKDAKYADLREEIPPVSFALTAQEPQVAPWMAIMIRSSGPESVAASIVRRVFDEEHVPTPGVVIFREQIRETLMREHLMSWLSGFFGVVAGLLSAIGLYGVMSYMVARRTGEIAIRIALGATRADILRLTLGRAGVQLAAGLAVGILMTSVLGRTARHLLFELGPSDPTTIVLATLALTAVTLAAAYIPAARAARVSPIHGLRED